ncbi:MAG: hypothetical protein KJO40_05335 [Deltaproteobacteria bacterium]|nr:hypothetical protein [Deltaproteobacteria bacterium]NND28230.1 hypothetical protein [Myxococcales bacterium]MBT8483784.1 hypothetical protein [Deltaproteobacteria bacterium]NNK07146.1 hypothetical protein [Myxococcales bacterium]NNK42369.1 hypothetical protein [Myxococcales bacterium]
MVASRRFLAGAVGPLASLLTLAACTEGSAIGEPDEAAPAPAAPEMVAYNEEASSRFGLVPLHAGFSPDPRIVSGEAIGEVRARSIHRKCKGWISERPDYLLETDTAFFNLHVLARSRSDTLLVVRKPDGSVVCNDNRNKTKDPMLRSHFPIGTTQVWIGVHDKGATAHYRLGFSEVKWRSSSIPLPGAD